MESKVLDIRSLGGDQFQPLLRAEVQAWKQILHWDYAASAELIYSYLDQKRLYGFALLEDGLVKGYCLYFCEGAKGSIGDLFVEPGDLPRMRVAPLLERAIEQLCSTPGIRRIEAQLPHCNVEQVSHLFHARSFQIYLRQFMTLHLKKDEGRASPLLTEAADSPDAEETPSGDFFFLPWERRFDREAAHLLHHVYRDHIDAALNDQYRSFAGTGRLIESIVRYRGCGDYLEHASTVAMHRSTGKLAGILGITAVRAGTAHVPQIAVAAGYQDLGLGSAMLHASFNKLARDGFSEVSLTVTSLNTRAVRLYERLGFRTLREFGAYVWDKP